MNTSKLKEKLQKEKFRSRLIKSLEREKDYVLKYKAIAEKKYQKNKDSVSLGEFSKKEYEDAIEEERTLEEAIKKVKRKTLSEEDLGFLIKFRQEKRLKSVGCILGCAVAVLGIYYIVILVTGGIVFLTR